MNYLAHALLSPSDPHILMGNLWGDLLKPRDYSLLPIGIRSGISIHKQIDAFTDRHPSVQEIVDLLRPFQGKYTPVVADVLMDFILSKYWKKYQSVPLEIFCQSIYSVVENHLSLLPERLYPRMQRMLSHQWLESCANETRMENTLNMLSRRAKFENKIPDALRAYKLHEEKMDELFHKFFRDVQFHVTLQSAD